MKCLLFNSVHKLDVWLYRYYFLSQVNFHALFFADANSSVSVNTLCEVKYKSNLILHCPPNNTSSLTGEWWREDPVTKKLISVCHNRSCTIKGPLHDQDSGLYFCQESSERKYYVNVTILG